MTCAGRGNYSHFKFVLHSDGTLRSQYKAELCVSLNADKTLSALTCDSPPSSRQTWTHTAAGQLQTGTGHCVTSGKPAAPSANNITAVFGRPLSSTVSPSAGAYALLFVNGGERSAEVICDAACAAAMDLPTAFGNTAYPLLLLTTHRCRSASRPGLTDTDDCMNTVDTVID